MAILVLGGAGYIGSHTVYELIDAGRDVVVADDLETGFRAAVHPKARFYELDIRDQASLDRVFEKENIDGVIHFAAFSQVGESMTKPLKYYENNLWGTTSLLKSMVAHGVDKIVFSSSTAATYGEPERVPILENDKTQPTNCYGETKLAMEKMMGWTGKAHDLRYVALRYFNACGAHPSGEIGEAHDPETHLIPLILQVPLGKREKISVFGDDYPTHDGTMGRSAVHTTEQFKANPGSVLLATGAVWEGFDFLGDCVSLLIIPRLPFAVPDALKEKEREKYTNLRLFIRAVVVPEMQIKLTQGFERAIRTETDTCVVAILDERAARGRRYYEDALAALPEMRSPAAWRM